MSQNGLNHLKSFEKLRLRAYDDAQPNVKITSRSQVKGTLTIGYGHTKGVFVGQTINEAKASQLFKEDIQEFESYVAKYVKSPLTQNMFDALVDFAYTIGPVKFKASTLVTILNKGNYIAAAEQFLVWKIPSGILARRRQQQSIFLDGLGVNKYVYNVVKKSSATVEDIAKVVIPLMSF